MLTVRRGISSCLTCNYYAKTVDMRLVMEMLFKALLRPWYFASLCNATAVCPALLFLEEEKGILLIKVCSPA